MDMNEMEFREMLLKMGFTEEDDLYTREEDSILSQLTLSVWSEKEEFEISCRLYNPLYGEKEDHGMKTYIKMVDDVANKFAELLGQEPSVDESWGCEDVDYSFSYIKKYDIKFVNDYIESMYKVGEWIVSRY